MTNKEYIEQHPEQFRDDIDKWLFTEFSIIGGCSSAHGSVEYSVARLVAERLFKAQGNRTYYECMDEMKKQWLDKACEWLYDYNRQQAKRGARAILSIKDFTINVEDFKKAMED